MDHFIETDRYKPDLFGQLFGFESQLKFGKLDSIGQQLHAHSLAHLLDNHCPSSGLPVCFHASATKVSSHRLETKSPQTVSNASQQSIQRATSPKCFLLRLQHRRLDRHLAIQFDLLSSGEHRIGQLFERKHLRQSGRIPTSLFTASLLV